MEQELVDLNRFGLFSEIGNHYVQVHGFPKKSALLKDMTGFSNNLTDGLLNMWADLQVRYNWVFLYLYVEFSFTMEKIFCISHFVFIGQELSRDRGANPAQLQRNVSS